MFRLMKHRMKHIFSIQETNKQKKDCELNDLQLI